jgi:starch synthase
MSAIKGPEDSTPSVLIAASEVTPFAQTGGLGDVMGSLPSALARLGARVSVVMPAYRSVLQSKFHLEDTGHVLSVPVGGHTETGLVFRAFTADNIPVFFIRADKYFDRNNLYGYSGGDYPDNAERFTFFSRAILELLRIFPHQVLHANDWHTALAVAFLKSQPSRYSELAGVKTVMTIHNLGYQGRFPNTIWPLLDLDASLFNYHFLEFYNDVNFLKGGIVFADAVTTVSPGYASEIQTPEQGFGLDGVLRERSRVLYGILNGVDYDIWDPGHDHFLTRIYNSTELSGKKQCKKILQKYFRLHATGDETPIVGMVTRLSRQKGLDLVQADLDRLLSLRCQFVLLGSGEQDLQNHFRDIARSHAGDVGIEIGFRDDLAHRIIAGSDMILMPSLYEPGGLTQLYGLKYGSIPIVRATGGLRDTVTPYDPLEGTGNGFTFTPYTPDALLAEMRRAVTFFRQKDSWARIVTNAMQADFSWERSAREYLGIYRRILSG